MLLVGVQWQGIQIPTRIYMKTLEPLELPLHFLGVV